jgi:hypothetical protein
MSNGRALSKCETKRGGANHSACRQGSFLVVVGRHRAEDLRARFVSELKLSGVLGAAHSRHRAHGVDRQRVSR